VIAVILAYILAHAPPQQLRATIHAELSIEPFDVGVNGRLREAKPFRCRILVQIIEQAQHDFLLTPGKPKRFEDGVPLLFREKSAPI